MSKCPKSRGTYFCYIFFLSTHIYDFMVSFLQPMDWGKIFWAWFTNGLYVKFYHFKLDSCATYFMVVLKDSGGGNFS